MPFVSAATLSSHLWSLMVRVNGSCYWSCHYLDLHQSVICHWGETAEMEPKLTVICFEHTWNFFRYQGVHSLRLTRFWCFKTDVKQLSFNMITSWNWLWEKTFVCVFFNMVHSTYLKPAQSGRWAQGPTIGPCDRASGDFPAIASWHCALDISVSHWLASAVAEMFLDYQK